MSIMGIILLPPPLEIDFPLSRAIRERRSIRSFKEDTLTLEELATLLWAGQGITDERRKLRASPSAGALYPLTLYLVNHSGVFRYLPEKHALETVKKGDVRYKLCLAALGQPWVREAPCTIVIAGDVNITAKRYGDRAWRYVWIEVGHTAQNILLQAVALGLGGVPVGAFYDEKVHEVLNLPPNEDVLYLIPIGRPR